MKLLAPPRAPHPYMCAQLSNSGQTDGGDPQAIETNSIDRSLTLIIEGVATFGPTSAARGFYPTKEVAHLSRRHLQGICAWGKDPAHHRAREALAGQFQVAYLKFNKPIFLHNFYVVTILFCSWMKIRGLN